MMEEKIEKPILNTSNLLHQVSVITNNYDKIAEITGEKYNVFNLLGLKSNELSHSAVLANLLNAKGSHGQKDLFLKLFIETIQNKFLEENLLSLNENVAFDFLKIKNLNKFQTEKSKAEKEKHLGKVNLETSDGGFIDIYITDGKNKIVIENKIYAGDQEKQLERYSKVDENAPIFYLNLFGDKPSAKSTNGLIENIDFYVITYRDEISNWIEKCIEKVVNKPILRETLNQYLNLIKELTYQSNNSAMKNEIVNEMIKTPLSFSTSVKISNTLLTAKVKIWKNFGEIIIKLLQDKIPGATIVLDENFGKQYQKIRIKNPIHSNRFMHLSFLKDAMEPYIEIHPGSIDGKPLGKNFTFVDDLQESLKHFKNKPTVKVEDTKKAWQGEWVCRYDVIKSKYEDVISENTELFEEVVNDLSVIYEAYSNLK